MSGRRPIMTTGFDFRFSGFPKILPQTLDFVIFLIAAIFLSVFRSGWLNLCGGSLATLKLHPLKVSRRWVANKINGCVFRGPIFFETGKKSPWELFGTKNEVFPRGPVDIGCSFAIVNKHPEMTGEGRRQSGRNLQISDNPVGSGYPMIYFAKICLCFSRPRSVFFGSPPRGPLNSEMRLSNISPTAKVELENTNCPVYISNRRLSVLLYSVPCSGYIR